MKKRILIVDDTEINRRLAAALLKRDGWDTTEAHDGQSGLAILASESFDAVLLDISMPGLNGEDVCRLIRSTPALKHLPVIAYTAHAMPEEKDQILACGFDTLLIKPISAASLAAALAAVLPGPIITVTATEPGS
jgi:CheY-like chemotaxis protein